jgi:DNA gyrase subunit A
MQRKVRAKTVAFADPASIVVPETEIIDVATDRYTEFLIASNERAVPDIRDGLKPVHRRVLLGFKDTGASATSRHYKAALLVGVIMGDYHPHGDVAIYDAAVKMSQDFAMRYPLLEGSGNFGSIDGLGAAAMRYTEMRTSPVGDELLRDLENREAGIVDWGGNYSNEKDEPHCLPSHFPQLLSNGILTGIGTGYSAMWLPHNLREVVDAIVAVIKDPSLPAAAISRYIKGPDFPTGGIVMGTAGFESALETGKGTVVLRAKIVIEENPRETLLVITEIPWQKEKTALREAIGATMVKDKNGRAQIEGIALPPEDQTGNDWLTEMRIVVTLKRDANPKVVANQLYKYTSLQTSFTYNQMAYVNGYPKLVSIREAIDYYIAHQFDVMTRLTKYRRRKALAALEIQEAYILADKYADKIVPMARAAANRAEIEAKLPSIIPGINANQCAVIAGMALYRFSKIDTAGAKEQIVKLRAEIAEYDRLLGSRAAMTELLLKDLHDIRERFGDDRRTEINASDSGEIKTLEELVPDEACWLTLSASGLVARLPESAFKSQKRGASGVNAAKSDEDPIIQATKTRTRERVWLLTDRGNLFSARVLDIEEVGRGARGTNVRRFLSLAEGEMPIRLVTPPADLSGEVVFATANGKVLRAKAGDFVNLNRDGLVAIKLVNGDRIVSAGLAHAGMHLLGVASDGYAVRFTLDDPKRGVPIQGRGSQGVASLSLGVGASVVSLTPIEANDKRDLALVLSNGRGKKSAIGGKDGYPVQGRAVRGVRTVDLATASKGQKAVGVVFAAPIADDSQVLFTTSASKVISMAGSEIKRQGRATAGVITVNLSASARNPETVTGGTCVQ